MENKNLELRKLENGNLLLIGRFPVNKDSEILFHKKRGKFFKEQIKSKAFNNALKSQKKVPLLLINHDQDKELKVVSFSFEEYATELEISYEFIPNEEVIKNIDSIRNMSFGFISESDEWTVKSNGLYMRRISKFKEISEFSILINREPAYADSWVGIYDREEGREIFKQNAYINSIKGFIKICRKRELKKLKEEINILRNKE